MSIIISEDLWWPLPDRFGEGETVEYDAGLVGNRETLLTKVRDARVLIVRNKTQVDKELLNAAPNLEVVGRLGVGLDNIDVPPCRERNIKVIAARGCNATSVAEYVMACLLDNSRFLAKCSQRVKDGHWDRDFGTGHELFGKTLGLVGVGDIGQRVASRAKAFGLNVVAFDPFVLSTSALVQDTGVELVGLQELLGVSHFVSIHVPLTPQTKYLLAHHELDLMREDSVLINTARGGIVNEKDLYEMLSRAPERHAYLDVREQEPPNVNDELYQLENITFTPHIAGITKESSARVAEFILQQVERALRGENVQGLV